MAHHLNPFTEGCLLGTPGEDWESNRTLAGLPRNQLAEALQAGAAPASDEYQWREKQQAEPYLYRSRSQPAARDCIRFRRGSSTSCRPPRPR
jgi:hypothetical protein